MVITVIAKLSEATQKVSSGRLTVHVDCETEDELKDIDKTTLLLFSMSNQFI